MGNGDPHLKATLVRVCLDWCAKASENSRARLEFILSKSTCFFSILGVGERIWDFWGGPSPVVIRTYSWLCAQRSPLAVLTGPYIVPRIQSGLVMCKTSALPTKLSLQPTASLDLGFSNSSSSQEWPATKGRCLLLQMGIEKNKLF